MNVYHKINEKEYLIFKIGDPFWYKKGTGWEIYGF